MSFFDKLKSGAEHLGQELAKGIAAGRQELSTQVGRFRNRKFLEGTVALCASVAMASNGAGSEEKQKMIGFIKNSPELKVFDTAEVIEFFNKLVSNFDFDKDIGKGEAMKYIARLKDDQDAARLMIRVGIAIGKSDGNFDKDEQNAVREACNALGLNPAEFDL